MYFNGNITYIRTICTILGTKIELETLRYVTPSDLIVWVYQEVRWKGTDCKFKKINLYLTYIYLLVLFKNIRCTYHILLRKNRKKTLYTKIRNTDPQVEQCSIWCDDEYQNNKVTLN